MQKATSLQVGKKFVMCIMGIIILLVKLKLMCKRIQKVERVFEWYEYSEERKCKVAALEFTDYALLWWENLKIQRRRDEEEEIITWATMKRVMKKRFVPDYYKQELYIRLQTLRQGSLSMEEYVK